MSRKPTKPKRRMLKPLLPELARRWMAGESIAEIGKAMNLSSAGVSAMRSRYLPELPKRHCGRPRKFTLVRVRGQIAQVAA